MAEKIKASLADGSLTQTAKQVYATIVIDEYLQRAPCRMRQREIATSIGIVAVRAVRYAIKELRDRGMIEVRKDGRYSVYTATKDAA